jgi:plasmid stabilization system protein ParE
VKLRVTARAANQVRAVDAWWRDHRGDAAGFLDELSAALQRLATSPELGALYAPKADFGVRRLLLPNCQHYLYYVHVRDQRMIRILAVWSCYRGRGPGLGSLSRKPRPRA